MRQHASSARDVNKPSPRHQDPSVLKLYTYSLSINRQKRHWLWKNQGWKPDTVIKIHADCPHPGLASPDGEKRSFFVDFVNTWEERQKMWIVFQWSSEGTTDSWGSIIICFQLRPVLPEDWQGGKGEGEPGFSEALGAASARNRSAPKWLLQKCRLCAVHKTVVKYGSTLLLQPSHIPLPQAGLSRV